MTSIWRLSLGMELGIGEPVLESVRLHHDHDWYEEEEVPSHVKEYLKTSHLYLHDTPVPELMGYKAMDEHRMFELGTWGYSDFLELSPTSAWAILRARYLSESREADGRDFEYHLRELLSIIMPVYQIPAPVLTHDTANSQETVEPNPV